MARLWSSGFENNTVTGQLEIQSITGSPSISSTTFRSGAYALEIVSLSSGSAMAASQQFLSAEGASEIYVRGYLRIATLPTAQNRVILLNDSNAQTTPSIYITLDSGGLLRLFDEDGQIGSASSALSTGTWYRIEVHFNTNLAGGSQVVEARIDGVAFASSSSRNIASTNSPFWIQFGGNLGSEAQTQGNWFFDDVAVNNTSGSTQTSWPGTGSIVHLRPNAAGDNNNAVSGDYTDVDEVTPDSAATIVVLDDNNDILDVNCESSSSKGIGPSDSVLLIQVGVNLTLAVAGTSAGNLRLKSASGGTTTSANLTSLNVSGTYRTHGLNAPFLPVVTSYTDPTTGFSWTPTGTNSLDHMQIGIQITDAAPDVNVTALWALVEYTTYDDLETLTDDYDDNSTNTSKWDAFNDTNVTTSETSNILQVAMSSATGGQYGGYVSDNYYNLTGSYGYTEVVNAGNQALEMDVVPIELRYDDNGNKLAWVISGDTLIALYSKGASDTTLRNDTAYSSSTHKFFRIREDSGTVYWDYSTDGSSWTNYDSETVANLFPVTRLNVHIYAGIWGSAGSTTVQFDDFNIAQSAGTAVKDLIGSGIIPFAR